MDDMLLVAEELSKEYKKVKAVDSVNLHIKKGTIYGLIGKNGAGKTTIMKMITGMATPSSGSFTYSGFEGDKRDAYSRIGALIEAPALLPNLSAYDNIKLKCLAYGIGDDAAVLDYKGKQTLVTTDMLMEGVHFDLLSFFFLWAHDYFYFCFKYTTNNAEIQEKTCK